MTVKRSGVEPQILSKRIERPAICKEELYRTDISVVSAVLNQRNTVLIFCIDATALFKEIEYQLGATIREFAEHACQLWIIH